jgi:urease accessory protein
MTVASAKALRIFLAGVVCLLAPLAKAHHVNDLATPTTFGSGLLSGLGHPVIGLGSLVFLLAIGFWCAQFRAQRRATGISTYLALAALLVGTGAGGLLDAAGFVLPGDHLLVAISVIAGGMLLLRKPYGEPNVLRTPSTAVIAAIGLASVAHGMVAAEGSAGATAVALAAYWIGILLMQTVLWFLAYRFAATMMAGRPLLARRAGFVGAVVAMLAGAALLAYPGAALVS